MTANLNDQANVFERNDPIFTEEKQTILDQILDEYGYSWQIWKIVIGVFCCFIIDGYSSAFLSMFILPLKQEFKLIGTEISFLGILFFITKFLGSFLCGYMTLYFKRIIVIHVSMLSSFFIIFFLGIFLSYPMLCVNQIIGGFFAGILEATTLNLLCEFTPIRWRACFLLSVWTGYSLGNLFPYLIMLVVMPDLSSKHLEPALLYCSLVALLCLMTCIFTITDSPRNNILQGDRNKAFETLCKFKEPSFFTEEIKSQIITEVNEGLNRVASPGLMQIFSKNMIALTILLSILNFGANMTTDGSQLLINLILDKINQQNAHELQPQNSTVLVQTTIIAAIAIPSNIILGILTEMKLLGRRYSMFMGFMLVGICITPVIFFPKSAYIFLGLFQFFTCVSNLINVYTSEIYPTRIRDFALGYIGAIGFAGSCVSQYLFVVFHRMHIYITPIVIFGISTINAIICIYLKVETYHRPLDVEDSKGNSSAKRTTMNDDVATLVNNEEESRRLVE